MAPFDAHTAKDRPVSVLEYDLNLSPENVPFYQETGGSGSLDDAQTALVFSCLSRSVPGQLLGEAGQELD